THGGLSQWLHSVGMNCRFAFGYLPTSFSRMVVSSTLLGALCSTLHAMTQALQPLHRFRSMAIAYLLIGVPLLNFSVASETHGRTCLTAGARAPVRRSRPVR